MRLVLLLVFASVFASALEAHSEEPPLMVVDLGLHSPEPSLPIKLAALACSGLFNRNPATPAYTLIIPEDEMWFNVTNQGKAYKIQPVSVDDFLKRCLASAAAGYIRYNFTEQQRVVPNLATLAAVLDAVPLEDGNEAISDSSSLVFDATKDWAGFDELEATRWMFERFGNATTGLAKMDPGYSHKDPLNPPLTGSPNLGFVDYIVKEKIFNFFLARGCVPLTKEHQLMEDMMNNSPFWRKPAEVYGYDDSVDPGGSMPLYESETLCVHEHDMGLACTDNVNNYAFYSRTPAIDTPLRQNPDPSPAMTYNSSKTYLTLVVGDGDNTGYIKTTRFAWFQERLARCQHDPSYLGCFPLVWTISPHLTSAPFSTRDLRSSLALRPSLDFRS